MSKDQKSTIQIPVETVDNWCKTYVKEDTMSKNQKSTIQIPVETVDNWCKTLIYVIRTLKFWSCNKKWPINLCCDGLNAISNNMYEIVHSVSRGNINDK